MATSTDWKLRHATAWTYPNETEQPIVGMMKAWAEYGKWHKTQYGSSIGDDGVLGKEWAAIGSALRGLLNGDLGRLDGGTLDSYLYVHLSEVGFDPDLL